MEPGCLLTTTRTAVFVAPRTSHVWLTFLLLLLLLISVFLEENGRQVQPSMCNINGRLYLVGICTQNSPKEKRKEREERHNAKRLWHDGKLRKLPGYWTDSTAHLITYAEGALAGLRPSSSPEDSSLFLEANGRQVQLSRCIINGRLHLEATCFQNNRTERKKRQEERHNAKRPRRDRNRREGGSNKNPSSSITAKMRDGARPGHHPRSLGYFLLSFQ